MATIGLDKLYYAPITENADGEETYGEPAVLAKAISAELSVELNEAILYADDGAAEVVKEFKSGTLTLASTISARNRSACPARPLTQTAWSSPVPTMAALRSRSRSVQGSRTASTAITGCTVSSSVSRPPTCRQGRLHQLPDPTIEGTILRRNKVRLQRNHPWKAEVESADGVDDSVIEPGTSMSEPRDLNLTPGTIPGGNGSTH